MLRKIVRSLASLRLNVALLSFLILALAAGTLVESRLGPGAALAVFHAPWFHGALALLAINLLCSMWEHRPWDRSRLGFLLTHGSMVLILAGATITETTGIGGALQLWEGEQTAHFTDSSRPGRIREFQLPFEVRLDAFEIDHYPGTQLPATYRSRLTILGPGEGEGFATEVEMNRELSHAGYQIFQTSYRQTPERDMTILTVSRDLGRPVVYLGYLLLLAGMSIVFFDRRRKLRVEARLGPPPDSAGPTTASPSPFKIVAVLALPLLIGAASPTDFQGKIAGLAVQHDGRVKPLDSLAREGVWRVTERDNWEGVSPVSTVLEWTFEPQVWMDAPIVFIGSDRLAEELELDPSDNRASFNRLIMSPQLLALLRESRSTGEVSLERSSLLEAARKLEVRLSWLRTFSTGQAYRIVPARDGFTGTWTAPEKPGSPQEMLALGLGAQRGANLPAGVPGKLRLELLANRLQPLRIAWWLLGAGALLGLIGTASGKGHSARWTHRAARSFLLAGFLAATLGLALRGLSAGRFPATNLYESLLLLGWGVGLFAVVAAWLTDNRLVQVASALLATLGLALADLLPLDPFIHPTQPVLAGSIWLGIHVPIIMISYAVLTLGVAMAHVRVGLELTGSSAPDFKSCIDRTLYGTMHVGSILLIAGVITGSVWAASSWGRYWGWDPKEVWSLIAFLAYMAILHARVDGLLKPFETAVASILAFWTIVMTYLGVNFLIASGLHSYAFGESKVAGWMLGLALAEALFLAAAGIARMHRTDTVPSG